MKSRAYYNEIDEYCTEWLENLINTGLIAEGIVDGRSIIEVKEEDLSGYCQVHLFAGAGVWSYALRKAKFSDGFKIWTVSCPCQPFSAAGKREGLNDERNLWPEAYRLIKYHRPLYIVGEQVASQDALEWLDVVQPDLESSDYSVGVVDTCAAGFGAPQLRQRLYWFACANSVRRNARIGGDSGDQNSARGSHGAEFDRRGCIMRSANAERERLERYSGAEDVFSESGWFRTGEVRSSPSRCPVNGFWSNAIWLPCSDSTSDGRQKYRPTEPGLLPMAPRSASHVGRLRAYGNALCAPQAIAFLECVKEIIEPEEDFAA